jgi:hypothetical protein
MALGSSRRGSTPAHQAGALGGGRRRPRAHPGRAMTRPLTRALLVGFIAAGVLAALAASANAQVRSDAVTAWNENAGKAVTGPTCLAPANNPIHESRIYAVMHVAIHDALNAIDRRSRPYALATQRALPGASPDAAVAAAARDVLVTLLEQLPGDFKAGCAAGVASVEADYAAALAAIPDGTAKNQGVYLGRAAAAVILAIRAGDGADDIPLADPGYPQGTRPGEWRFTPGFPFAFLPRWGEVTPFVLRDSSQFRPRPPYAVTGRKYAADLNEVKDLGGDDLPGGTPSARTAEQTEIALFWVENSPLQWNRIARTVSADRGLDLWENARLFGLLNIALADGYIGTFETKYHYNYWRPVTAIRAADTDGNPKTSADPTWTPLVPTPPIPDYDSGHSVEGGAAAQVLTRFFGTDRISFETCSLTLLPGSACGDGSPVLRSYTSFSQAREENGVSRILVGFHFRKAVDEGIKHGRKIGNRAVDRFLRPAN